MIAEGQSLSLSASCSAFRLPFYSSNEHLRHVVSRWNDEHSVPMELHQNERTFLRQVCKRNPSVVVFGVDKELLDKEIIARIACLKRRPVIVALVESTRKSAMLPCYQQGADRVVVVSQCSSRIFQALITALQSREIYYPPYRFNAASQICSIGEREVWLTAKRFNLAQYMFVNQGKLLSRQIILKDVWGLEGKECTTRRLEVHVSYLRKQLSLDGSLGWVIRTKRNKGYGVFQIFPKNQRFQPIGTLNFI